MILPNESETRNRLILSYLLAELPQEEIAELDAEMLTQPEFLSVFEEGVADVMDAYADGTLDAASAARVEQLVRLRPSAQKQLNFAQALKGSRLATAGSTGEARSVEPKGSRERQGGWLLPWTRVRLITTIAAILLVLVTGLLLARRSAVRGTAGNAARLDATARVPVATKGEGAPSVFTVILLPTVLRGAPQKAVKIPAETNSIRLQVQLPARSTTTVGTLRLSSADGEDIRRFSGLSMQTIEMETYVEVSMPAAQLPPGAYKVTVTDSDGKQLAEYALVLSH